MAMDIAAFFKTMSAVFNALLTVCCNSWVNECFEHWSNCEESKRKLEQELRMLRALLRETEGINETMQECLQELRNALDDGDRFLKDHATVPSSCPPCARIELGRGAKNLVQTIKQRFQDYNMCGQFASQVSNSKGLVPKKKKRSYPVPDLVVGMNYHKEALVELLLSSDVHRIGICGQGGCGKTLLAHLLQNDEKVKRHFEDRIYCIDIEMGTKKNARELHSMLHKEIAGEDRCFDSEANGKAELYTLLKDSKCLLVIDNAWNREELECLNVLEPKTGSKILVTTRSSELLHEFQAKKWIIETLSDADSLKLFYKHAFGDDDDKVDGKIKGIANEVIKYFNGLPLALKLMGSSMSSKKSDLRGWLRFQKQIKDSGIISNKNPTTTLNQRLKFTYDELSPRIQECFLNLAALPHRFNVYDATVQWKSLNLIDSDEDAVSLLEILLNLFLISDYDPNYEYSKVNIHDVLRDLAAYIMDTEKPCQLIWKMKEGLMEFPEFSETVRTIHLNDQELECLPKPITALQLQFLNLDDNPLTSGFPMGFFQAFPNLKVLSLDRIKAEIAVERLAGLRKLECLYLSRAEDDYRKQGHFSCKADQNKALDLLNLKFVFVSNYCPSFLTSSSFIQELYMVVSYQCLLHLPRSLKSSKESLKHLSIFVCDVDTESDVTEKEKENENICLFADMEFKNLRNFSFHIGELPPSKVSFISKMYWQAFRKLQILSLSNLDWSQVTFTSFVELQQLDIYDCRIEEIPYAKFDHRLLSKSEYKYCWNHLMLQMLPDGIETLQQLEVLNVAMCPIIDLKCGKEQGNFPKLKKLFVYSEKHVPPELKARNIEVVEEPIGHRMSSLWAAEKYITDYGFKSLDGWATALKTENGLDIVDKFFTTEKGMQLLREMGLDAFDDGTHFYLINFFRSRREAAEGRPDVTYALTRLLRSVEGWNWLYEILVTPARTTHLQHFLKEQNLHRYILKNINRRDALEALEPEIDE